MELIKIKGVPPNLKMDLKTISKNSGLTMTAFIKQKLRQVVDSAPEHLKVRREA